MFTIEYAVESDLHELYKLDNGLASKDLLHKINEQKVIVVRDGATFIGCLRYGLFWDEIPFMNMLKIKEAYQRHGIGRNLVGWWESEVKSQGYKQVLVSTQSNELAQHFYRALGYKDIGGFVLPSKPLELLFHKAI